MAPPAMWPGAYAGNAPGNDALREALSTTASNGR